jgi:glutamine phosphoribosylpyrophosphate amidotransferase
MCAIIGSFNKKTVIDLIEKNQHRGRVAYSISLFNLEDSLVTAEYGNGEFDAAYLENMKIDGCYIVCHLQSPTGIGDPDGNSVHPNIINNTQQNSYLWHNGILMPSAMQMLQQKFCNSTFDTFLLHQWLAGNGSLDDIEGSFACVFIVNGSVKLFRSKHAKLYIDENMTISSEYFEGSKCINADRIYEMNFTDNSLVIESYFKTKRYNIIIEGDLDD